MKKAEFEQIKPKLKPEMSLALTIRGNYGNYVITGKLVKITEKGYIELAQYFSHHYKRIISIGYIETS
jgi:hypothetical protein